MVHHDTFSIDFDWLDCSASSHQDRFTQASLGISVNDIVVTELQDLLTKTVRPKMRVSAYDFAVWLMENWWRVVYEPERKGSLSWEMSHCMGSIGQGFLWPEICFISDGAVITVESKATPRSAKQMARYLNSAQEQISKKVFIDEVFNFVDAVIGRLNESSSTNHSLIDLRNVLNEEIQNPEESTWRQFEALLGFDPDEAPKERVESLLTQSQNFGEKSVCEVIASTGAVYDATFEWLESLHYGMGVCVTIPDADLLKKLTMRIDPDLRPWERAEDAAKIVKKHWAISDYPVSSHQLSDLFSFLPEQIKGQQKNVPMALGLRNGESDSIDTLFNSNFETNNRFSLLRVVADHFYSSERDRILPVTKVRTARQKFQRAFAQEFLCPADQLNAFIDDDLSEENIENAARHFNVSSRLVATTLLNKDILDRQRYYEKFSDS